MGSSSSKEKKKDTETAKQKAAREKEIKSMTKDCMKKGPWVPGKEWACRKGSKMQYKKMKKMKEKYDKPSVGKQIANGKKKIKSNEELIKF